MVRRAHEAWNHLSAAQAHVRAAHARHDDIAIDAAYVDEESATDELRGAWANLSLWVAFEVGMLRDDVAVLKASQRAESVREVGR